jgi:hypothetical protein
MLLNSWIAQSEHRAWEERFNVRAARGDFVREPSSRPARGSGFQLAVFINRIRLGLQRPQRVQGQA